MKKLLVILLAFALVFGLAFTACQNGTTGGRRDGGDGGGGGELVWKTVFDMATDEGIQALSEGVLSFAGSDNPFKPLVRAGGDNDVTLTAVAGPTGQKIAIQYEAKANWGPGIDLQNGVFGFRLGDKITIEGNVLAIGAADSYIQPNFKVGNEGGHGLKETADGPFKWEIELDASMLADIKSGNPSGIRIDGRGKGGNTVPTGQKVVINNIHIEGNRPSNAKQLAAPVIKLTATGVEWDAIEDVSGYKIFAGDAADPVDTAGLSATEYNIVTSTKFKPTVYTEAAVTYSITVVAVGIDGVSKDSPKSNAVSFTKQPPAPPPQAKIKVNNVEQAVEVKGVGCTTALLAGDTGYKLTYGTAQYGAVYAYFEVDFGAGKSLSDYSTLTLKWKGTSGDVGWKTMYAYVSSTAFSGSVTEAGADASSAHNQQNNTEQTATFTLSSSTVSTQKAFVAITIWAAPKGSLGGADSPTVYEVYDIAFD